MNLYGYASGDPINRHDPFGLRDTVFKDDTARKAVAFCVRQSPECRQEVSDLANAKGKMFVFQTQDLNSPNPGGEITDYDPEGVPTGATITIAPGNFGDAAAFLGMPVTVTTVLAHEMGHALGDLIFYTWYGERVFRGPSPCNDRVACPYIFENIARRELGLSGVRKP